MKYATVIRGMGGSISVRDWQNYRRSKTRDVAESELQLLVDAGLAAWSYTQNPNGGRPSKIATLCDITP
jgi:hypothetical protein